ncbi:MAG: FAD-dependent oxidoreductase [Melioribacteraceae bacterium]|nr:FAD-dependent oxidoreductase [Melioribacteraceae bacterium]
MNRDIDELKTEVFDILVIGGGFHGLTMALEASKKGYKVGIIDKDDFGKRASANSLKIVHGGLRYLQQLDIKRIRESIKSRKYFQQNFPDLIKIIPFIIPTKWNFTNNKIALFFATVLYEFLSMDKNFGIISEKYLPKGRVISKNRFRKILSENSNSNAGGGMLWYEAVADTDSIIKNMVNSIKNNNSAMGANIEAKKLIIEDKKVAGVEVFDVKTNSYFRINAKSIVNTCGIWEKDILSSINESQNGKSSLTKAINLIINKNYFNDYAIGFDSVIKIYEKENLIKNKNRMFFVVPWKGNSMLGTFYFHYDGDRDNINVTDAEIDLILNEINSSNQIFKIQKKDIVSHHCDLLFEDISIYQNSGQSYPRKKTKIINHSKTDKIEGLYSVNSVKFTNAPEVTKKILTEIRDNL